MIKGINWKKTGIAAGIGIAAAMLEICRELHTFRVRSYRVKATGMHQQGQKIKAVFLADLHGRAYGKDNWKLVRAIRKENPDLILVGGDMLVRKDKDTTSRALTLMEQLVGIAPIYYANGNHEQKMKEDPRQYGDQYEVYARQLRQMGVTVLENESADIEIRQVPMTITGLEIPLDCYQHFRTVPLTMGEIKERIEAPKKQHYQILLAHNPTYMSQYKKWGSNLTLCGHLHGGIIRIPGIGGMITPQARLFPKYSGDMHQDGSHCGIVSRGLGTHTINIRLFNMAELVSIIIET